MYPHEYPLNTHACVPGTTGAGKSKLVEDMLRSHVLARPRPDCTFLLDWHGTLFNGAKDWLAFLRPDVPIVLLNPSNPTVVVPYDPFRARPGANLSTHLSCTAETIFHACGGDKLGDFATYARMVQAFLAYCSVSGEPFSSAMRLTYFHNQRLCFDIADKMPDPDLRNQWLEMALIKSENLWKTNVISVMNRIHRLTSSEAIKLFTSSDRPSLDLNQCIADGAIVLVNLQESDWLSADAARLFASLLLSDLLHTAIVNAQVERPCFLYLDECHEYLTEHNASVLNATRKAGVRATLIFQDFGRFHDKPALAASMKQNCGVKYVFRQENAEDAEYWAKQLFMDKINGRQIKEILYGLEIEYVLEDYETTTETWGVTDGETDGAGEHAEHGTTTSEHGESEHEGGGHNKSHAVQHSEMAGGSKQKSTRYAPRQHQVVRTINEYTREEKVSKVAGVLMKMRSRTCCRKAPLNDAEPFEVPEVDDLLLNPEDVLAFEKGLPAAITLEDAQRKQLEVPHPERSTHEPQRRRRAKKEAPRLFEP